MKNLASIILEIKLLIRSGIADCQCRHKGFNRRVIKLISFSSVSIIDKFDLAEIPVSGPKTFNVMFNALVLIDIDGNVKHQSYLNGNLGPLTISFNSIEYILDTSLTTFTGLSTD